MVKTPNIRMMPNRKLGVSKIDFGEIKKFSSNLWTSNHAICSSHRGAGSSQSSSDGGHDMPKYPQQIEDENLIDVTFTELRDRVQSIGELTAIQSKLQISLAIRNHNM